MRYPPGQEGQMEQERQQPQSTPPEGELTRREVRREDGRYLIYYEFVEKEEDPCQN